MKINKDEITVINTMSERLPTWWSQLVVSKIEQAEFKR